MKVISFRLSGAKYRGECAERMYAAAQQHGFERTCADFDPHSPHRGILPYTAEAPVSGVSACAFLAFESADELIKWLIANPPVIRAEDAAFDCYRSIRAFAADAAEEQEDAA